MRRTNIYLDDDTLRNLKLLAAARGTTMSDLVREGVDLLMKRAGGRTDWTSEVQKVLDKVRALNLPEISEAEIVADVRAYRAERRAALAAAKK